MTRDQLAEQLAETLDIPKTKADKAITTILADIGDALAKGETVQFTGFGKFATKVRKARTGRNPRTGEDIQIPERRVAIFTPGKDLSRLVER